MTQPKVQKIIPTTGQTIQIQNSDNDIILAIQPAGNLAALTVTFPTIPHAGMNVTITSSKDITTLASSGATLDKALTTLKALDTYVYTYNDIDNSWIQVESNNDLSAQLALIPRAYVNGVRKSSVKEIYRSAVVATGVARFYLTDNGLSTGAAICGTEVYIESINIQVFDGANAFVFGMPTVSSDRKYVDIPINRLATTNANGLINLIGSVVSFVTGIIFTAAANGTTAYLQIKGV